MLPAHPLISAADSHMGAYREFNDAIRSICGPTRRHTTPLRSKDAMTIMKDKEGILCGWQEHFGELLNRDSHMEADSLDNVPALPVR